jgi:hypothetical protein
MTPVVGVFIHPGFSLGSWPSSLNRFNGFSIWRRVKLETVETVRLIRHRLSPKLKLGVNEKFLHHLPGFIDTTRPNV